MKLWDSADAHPKGVGMAGPNVPYNPLQLVPHLVAKFLPSSSNSSGAYSEHTKATPTTTLLLHPSPIALKFNVASIN